MTPSHVANGILCESRQRHLPGNAASRLVRDGRRIRGKTLARMVIVFRRLRNRNQIDLILFPLCF